MTRKMLGFSGRAWLATIVALALLPPAAVPAAALEAGKDEKENLRACERRVCDIFLHKSLKGDDLKCGLVKTWEKSSIKAGVETGKISWTNGDARCEMNLSLSRAELVTAMTAPSHSFKFPEHTINCAIEEDKHVRNVSVVLSPEVEFKGGVAVGGKVRVKKIKAPFLMKAGIWTASTMIDKLGVFEKKLTGELNKLAQKRCPEQYGKAETVAAKKAAPAKGEKKEAKAEPAKVESKKAESAAKSEEKKPAAATGSVAAPAAKGEAKKAEPVRDGAAPNQP